MARARNARPIESDSLFGAATASAILHVTALVMAVVVWPYVAPPIPLPPDILPVELLPMSEETNIAAQEKAPEPPPDVKPLEMPPLPQPTPSFAPPPPPPEEDALAIEPEDKPPPEVKQPTPQPRFAFAVPRAKPKPEKPKEEFDINKIAGLVDKIAKEPQRKDEKEPAPAKAASQRSLAGVGAQTSMTMSEIDALRSQLARCWNVDPGAPDPAKLVFRVKMFLNEDGTVAAPPQLLDQGGLGDAYFRAAVDSAIRAVQMCQPYQLPPAKYATWAEITIEFDPRKMAGY